MAKKIFKYTLNPTRDLVLPYGARLLHVAEQHGEAVLWAEIETTNLIVYRKLAHIPTGGTPPKDGLYIGTFLMENGSLVFHVYDLGEQRLVPLEGEG